MTTTTTNTFTRISTFLSVPTAATPSHKLQLRLAAVSDKQVLQLPRLQALSTSFNIVIVNYKHARTPPSSLLKLFASTSSSSSPPASVQEVEEEEEEGQKITREGPSESSTSVRGCQACGKEEIERGCNGEGRIQGGIATVPGFGWWPIKAYRPCPSYLATGGRYRRSGQSMDEIGFGGGGGGGGRGGSSAAGNGENAQISKNKFKKLGAESAAPRS